MNVYIFSSIDRVELCKTKLWKDQGENVGLYMFLSFQILLDGQMESNKSFRVSI